MVLRYDGEMRTPVSKLSKGENFENLSGVYTLKIQLMQIMDSFSVEQVQIVAHFSKSLCRHSH